MVLLTCGVGPSMGMMMGVEKSALTIGLAIISGLLLIFVVYCLLDCVTATDLKIEHISDKKLHNQKKQPHVNTDVHKKSIEEIVVEDIE